MSSPQLSLVAAILININVMVGSGVFVNTVLLAQTAGHLGALAYCLMGLLLLPLMLTFARLMRAHPGGTFYHYGASIHPIIGFLSGWTYFIAKLASAALGIHVFSTLTQQFIPALSCLSPITLDVSIITLFVLCNMLNVRIGQSIQYGFLALKAIPLLFVILSGLYWCCAPAEAIQAHTFTNIINSLPFVLFAFTGFEACCSLSCRITNSQKNGPLAMSISYGIGVCVAVLYQYLFYSTLGPTLATLSGYGQAFPALLEYTIAAGPTRQFLFAILNAGIASSSLGAAYGIMYSNAWNLYVLGTNKHLFFSNLITRLNAYTVPIICVVVEGVIMFTYTILSQGSQVPLQQVLSLGMIITYCIGTLALLKTARQPLMPLLALVSCAILSFGYLSNVMLFGIVPTLLFAGVLMCGLLMYKTTASSMSSAHKYTK